MSNQRNQVKKIKNNAKIQAPQTNSEVRKIVDEDFVNRIKYILQEQTFTDSERINEVCSLVDEWRTAIQAPESIQQEIEFAWFCEQVENLSYSINTIDEQVRVLREQNNLVSAVSITRARNDANIRELELERNGLQKKLNTYNEKLSRRQNGTESR